MTTDDFKQEIIAYLSDEQSTKEAGLQLWAKYGRNKALDKMFYRPGDRYLQKMRYELAKIAGISFEAFNDGNYTQQAKVVEKITLWPPIIHRIKDEIETIVPNIADWHKQLVELGDANDDATKSKAVELGELLDTANARYQLIDDAKELWFKNGTLPDESVLYPSEPDADDPFGLKALSGAQLVQFKKNIESSLTKDRNQLLYQSKTKEEKENPMPEGDERNKVESRIANKTARLEAIIAILNAGESK